MVGLAGREDLNVDINSQRMFNHLKQSRSVNRHLVWKANKWFINNVIGEES